jgi:hypothetical protein
MDFSKKSEQCCALIQLLYYIKSFEQGGQELPSTIFVGDKDECFCLRTKNVIKFLSHRIDWNIPPSEACAKNPDLLEAMIGDIDILPWVFPLNHDTFSFGEVIGKLKDLSAGLIDHPIRITIDNIAAVFLHFQTKVIADDKYLQKRLGDFDRGRVSKLADLFFNCITDKENTYLHPRKKNILVSRGEEVRVKVDQFTAFFNHFEQNYTPVYLEELTACKDRIIEESHRRYTGAFFTPRIWVKKAHDMISEQFGEDWKEKYTVWDCASGTNNLTRDYRFRELYCSTLEQGDIETVRDMGYNPGSTIFQYDFLNDDEPDALGEKIPIRLRKAFEEKKPILLLLNPPYGTANERGIALNRSKKDIANTRTNAHMKRHNLGPSSQQLYAQFLYRIALLVKRFELPDAKIGIYAPPLFMSGDSYGNFRNYLYSILGFAKGMLFNANNFADVEDSWGISFTLWDSMKIEASQTILHVAEMDEVSFIVKYIGEASFIPTLEPASKWVREDLAGLKTHDAPQTTDGIKIKQAGTTMSGSTVAGALGYFYNAGNDVYNSAMKVGLFSTPISQGHGLQVIPGNLMKCVALFTARKLIKSNWINQKDTYSIPDISKEGYPRWNNDALVYALFHGSGRQSSLRSVEYKGRKWDIRNEFFFMSNGEMRELANQARFIELYQDSKQFEGERHIHSLLPCLEISPDAEAVLEAARELVRKSMPLRKEFHKEYPKYHLNAWDAGWVQIKPLLKKFYQKEFEDFTAAFRVFEDRMRLGVYQFGFLMIGRVKERDVGEGQ